MQTHLNAQLLISNAGFVNNEHPTKEKKQFPTDLQVSISDAKLQKQMNTDESP